MAGTWEGLGATNVVVVEAAFGTHTPGREGGAGGKRLAADGRNGVVCGGTGGVTTLGKGRRVGRG